MIEINRRIITAIHEFGVNLKHISASFSSALDAVHTLPDEPGLNPELSDTATGALYVLYSERVVKVCPHLEPRLR
jgi:hypothetical protein